MKFRILYLITDLQTGGANMMLYKLLTHTNRECFEPVVVVLEDKSRLGSGIEALGIRVHALGMKPGRPSVASLWKLGKLV